MVDTVTKKITKSSFSNKCFKPYIFYSHKNEVMNYETFCNVVVVPHFWPTAMIHISVPYSQLTLLFFIMGQKMKKPSRQGREVSEG